MIKFESVILKHNYNRKQNLNHLSKDSGIDFAFIYSSDLYKNGLTFTIEENKINFLKCKNNELLNDIFFTFIGFYKPELGNIIFGEYNINSFTLKQKAEFINNNFAIINDFDVYELNKTLINHLMIKLVCIGHKIKNALKISEQTLQSFNLFQYKDFKLKQLDEKKILDYFLLLMTINNPSYIFIKGIEKYFANKENEKYFFLKLELFLKNQVENTAQLIREDKPFKAEQKAKTIIFFSTQEFDYYSKKTFEIDIQKSIANDVLVIRNKSYNNTNNKNNSFSIRKNNISSFLKLMLKENLIYFLIFLCFEVFLNIGTIYSYLSFNFSTDKGLIIAIFSFFVILNILFNIFGTNIFFDRLKSLIFNMIIGGVFIFKILSLFMYLLILINLSTTIIVVIYPIILSATSMVEPFNPTIFIFLLIFPYLISLISFSLIFVYKHKRIIRRLNEFI